MAAMRSLILALVLAIISRTEGSRMSELDCGEGMMRGLDGACVKKFVIPKTKLECPKLSVDNGEIFLIGEIFCSVRSSRSLFEVLLQTVALSQTQHSYSDGA